MSFNDLIHSLRMHMALLVLLGLVLMSSLAVVYIKHVGRSEFISLQQLEQTRDQLNEEWGRLLLEESTWATPGRIEQQARARLDMIVPTADKIVVIKP